MSNYPDGTKVIIHSTSDHNLDGSLGTIRGAVKLQGFTYKATDLYIVELPFKYNGYSCMVLTSACLEEAF